MASLPDPVLESFSQPWNSLRLPTGNDPNATAAHAVPASRRLIDVCVLIRLPSCIAGALSVYLGTYLASGNFIPARNADYFVGAGIFFAVAAANALNDVLDVDVDALSKPRRPLPSGRFSSRSALLVAGGLALLALAATLPVGMGAVLWMSGLLIVAATYSLRLKSTILLGNIAVAVCASSPIMFGAELTSRLDASVWAAVGIAFGFMLTYEILKTASDSEADSQGGLSTIATAMGVQFSLRLFSVLIAVLTLVVTSFTLISSHPLLYVAVTLVAFVAPAWRALFLLNVLADKQSIRRSILLLRIAWFAGIFSLSLLR